jgi:hypothetical protein
MSKKYPATKNVKFILCEDVRMEANQKLALLGVFPADSITVLGPKASADGAGVAQLASLGILVMLKDLEGNFDARLRIADPAGNSTFDEAMGKVEIKSRGNATLAWKSQGFVVPKFGTFRAELMLDDRSYPFQFEIIDGSVAKRDTVG